MKKTLLLASILSTVTQGMQVAQISRTQRELSDQEISHAYSTYDDKNVPVFPSTTGVQISTFFPNRMQVQTIYNQKLWTFTKIKKSRFCTLSARKIFKRNHEGTIKRIIMITHADPENSFIRSENNAEIWDLMEEELRAYKLLSITNAFSRRYQTCKNLDQ